MATATQLPAPRAVFYDANGQPLAGGFVHTYVAGGGTTPKTTWQDAAETIPNANPIVLDAAGSCLLYGAGSYTLAVTDAAGNAIPAYSGDSAAQANGADLTAEITARTAADVTLTTNVATAQTTATTATQRAGSTRAVEEFGAVGNGVTDDGPAIRSAIAAVAAAGGGHVLFAAKTYQITTGTLAITASSVQLQGAGQFATVLRFANGTADCITIIGAGTGVYINGNAVRDLSITCVSKTGGRAMYLNWLFNAHVERVYVNNCWTGFEVGVINTVTMRDVSIAGILQGAGGYGIWWHTAAPTLSIELNLDNVLINPLWSGADGILWDGPAFTLNCYLVVMLDVRIGLWVRNTVASNAFYPQFLEALNLVVDGASSQAVRIEGGANFHFTNCEISNTSGEAGQGSADTNALWIGSDAGASETHEAYFSNCNIGLSKSTAVITAAHDVTFSNCRFGAGATLPAGTQPAVLVSAPASDTLITGCKASYFGSLGGWTYAVSMAAGTFRTLVIGCNFNVGLTVGAVLNSSGDLNSFANEYIGPPASGPGPVVTFPRFAVAPAFPITGETYFDTAAAKLRTWDGAAWQILW